MSEQERGTYTPPRDEPLAFDSGGAFDARGARDARPMPMTLIASGVVLVVLVCGVVIAYVGGFRGKDDPSKAVGDKVVSMKTVAAPDQASPADPAGRLEVFSNRTTASAAPAFTAGPEQPAERPKPQLQVQASTQKPVRIASGDEASTPIPEAKALTPAAVASATAQPAAKPAAKPSPSVASTAIAPVKTVADAKPAMALKPALSAAPAKPITAAKAAATAAKPTAATVAAATGGVGAQIGAFSSKDLADQGFVAVGKLAPTAGHGKRVEPVAHGTSTLFRTTVTGFADRDAAKAFCETLTAKGHACIVKG